MVQLRPRPSRTPASAEAMVDEGQPASEEEEAEHGLLLGQPSSGAAAEPLEDEEADEESDDEAPEELTFASAQAEAREEERRVRESARRDKVLLKEKRRRREELFVEQKKRKLLPDAVLQQLAAAPQTSIKKSPGKLKEVNLQKKKEECEKGSDSKKVKVQKVQSVGHQNKSYVALRLKDQELRDSRQQAARAFIHESLYGPGTNRTSVNKFLSLDNKRLPVKKAAAQFLNSAWGTQKKQNAKRYKRRWMIRKMKTPKK
ncbi:U3 small nucleolar RNA-associated protein NOL7 isoform X1 [Oryctolagus cuniculus]|uniref:U3 small nucleolar RNA-associated protein NOL7 isoform X1 n=1 Tax=Oryctolagus cuniculus TaxID=9986 RepID=UPI00222FE10C|nr:nucleolar protein 7 [Oryctolagus cuniculus]XP_051711053.1 nucleolar protein 7 [Oryctolagus cuniculus]